MYLGVSGGRRAHGAAAPQIFLSGTARAPLRSVCTGTEPCVARRLVIVATRARAWVQVC